MVAARSLVAAFAPDHLWRCRWNKESGMKLKLRLSLDLSIRFAALIALLAKIFGGWN